MKCLSFSRAGRVLLLATGLLVVGAGAAVTLTLRRPAGDAAFRPQTTVVPAGTFRHRVDGEFIRAGDPVDAPLVATRIATPVEIMTFQVTQGDYARCVAEGACQAPEQPVTRGDLPVTGVSYADATAYARWLSLKTGEEWRLPDDREWAYAAGSRFVDDARGLEADSTNPALRWLADYDREAQKKSARDPKLRPVGGFGANEHGVSDMAGNVWEWTRTCQRRVTVDAEGRALSERETCGIYVVEGQHRAMMSFFIRNPKSGGCSVATPPDHLGFRLVREPRWHQKVVAALRGRLRA